jgi:formate hydrogenlyase transcriptional activator
MNSESCRSAHDGAYRVDQFETGAAGDFREIIGASDSLAEALDLVRVVAPTESTALIEGESGTGKELIARAIHEKSKRSGRPFIKLNCAAIPYELIESELFGHERGAFTGAVARKIGRFEAANGGTLFLDEVGDTPLPLQAKLLRVLQEREFERLGSTRSISVDVRVIAATNRDLYTMVSEKRFRSDLYHRLNVFPIAVPPLRDRVADIPVLVLYFVKTFAQKIGKRIDIIPAEVMDAFRHYSWPGNVRELQNFIERSVILTPGSALYAPIGSLKRTVIEVNTTQAVTMADAERNHIQRTLEHTRWVVAGPNGAAARLGVKRSTLYFRMRKLGIQRPAAAPLAVENPFESSEVRFPEVMTRSERGNWAFTAGAV